MHWLPDSTNAFRNAAWRALLALALAAPCASAQTGLLQGRVSGENGSPVPGAAVMLLTLPDSTIVRTVETDVRGAFRIAGVAEGAYVLRVQSVGFEELVRAVRVDARQADVVELALTAAPVFLPGVSVETRREREQFEQNAGATVRGLDREEMKLMPGVAEADVLRAMEVLPGVVSTSDFSAAFNVRGGSADQNLILLDGLPIYNPFHLGGLFSVFNPDMIARAEMLAGGFPAEYGGRVSSVLNIESDAAGVGTNVDAGVSLLATRVSVGTPLPAPFGLRNGRARLSLRRSYFDQVLKPFVEFPYHLIDAQAYAEMWTADGARLSLTGYTGRDVLDFSGVDSFPLRLRWNWGNDVVGARVTVPFADGRELDVRAGYTRFATSIRFPDFDDTNFRSRIGHLLMRADLQLIARGDATLRTGIEANRLSYDNLAASGGTVFRGGNDAGWLTGAYAQATWRPDDDWLIEAGGRIDGWSRNDRPGETGPALVPAPRLAVKRFFADGDGAVKLAVGRYSQFLHSLRDEELPLGIDVWVLTGPRAPRQVSDQIQAGIEGFPKRDWFASLEGYYRDFDGVATNNFADDPNDPNDDLIAGTGTSWGADMLIRRDAGLIRPTLAISWLHATRDFADPTQGIDPAPVVRYPPIFDRRLDVELVIQGRFTQGVEAGLRWNFGTGLPFTRALAGYAIYDNQVINGGRWSFDAPGDNAEIGVVLGPRNAERYPAYHRLDVSVRKTIPKRWGRITPYIDVVNAYNRRNVLFYFYEYDRSPPLRAGVSMFPFLPTVGVEVSF